MVSNNECSVVQRTEREKISVFKSNLVDGKEIHVISSDKTVYTNPEQHIHDHMNEIILCRCPLPFSYDSHYH